MKKLGFGRCVTTVFAVASLVGCGSAGQPRAGVVPLGAATHRNAPGVPIPSGYKSLYSFEGPPDGEQPTAGLTYFKGVFFGTTSLGGYDGTPCNSCGTVFLISPAGIEHAVHEFAGPPDGAYPQAGLTIRNGALYGTTYSGGAGVCSGECGTVFKIDAKGRESIVYAFQGGADGANPHGGLLSIGNRLFGTTEGGGSGNIGTVFSISSDGTERTLHAFKGKPDDGSSPVADLVKFDGLLYGVTTKGGSQDAGTVFALDPSSGFEQVVHSFRVTDGEYPVGLTQLNGKLYGATSAGGPQQKGVVFSINDLGKFRIVHSFRGTPNGDGAYPQAPPTAVHGILFGTTRGGGSHGNGSVYELMPSGFEALLYSFDRTPDGVHPFAPLALHGGRLYGTTVNGGRPPSYGTVFRLTP